MLNLSHLSIRHRLVGLCMFLCLIAAIPLTLLIQNERANMAFTRTEQQGIQPALTLFKVIDQVQRHRGLSGPWLQGQDEMRTAREEAAAQVQQQLKAFAEQWQSTGLPGATAATAQAHLQAFEQLDLQVRQRSLTADASFAQHTALADRLLNLLFDVATQSNLLYDPQDTTYLMIVAGIQESPRISELAARMRGLGTVYLNNQGNAADVQSAMDSHGRLLERLAHLETHLNAVARLNPDLGQRLVKPALVQLQALRDFSADARNTIQGDTQTKTAAMQPRQFFDYATPYIRNVQDITLQITQQVDTELKARLSAARQHMVIQIVLVVALSALGLWIMIRMVRSIVLPIQRMQHMAEQLERGDLTESCATTQRDELGRCMNALDSARLGWVTMLGNLSQSVQAVSHTSEQIADGSHELSERTSVTASNLDSTSQAITELTSTVQQTAQSAKRADELARSAWDTANVGEKVMTQVVSNMNEISEASKKIADIIGLIDGIAFQTNILALNAAVEAARAGESGRGFAVVASEVRSLAQRTTNSAKEIKSLINNSLEKIGTGTQLVNQAGSNMQAIMNSNQQVTDIIGDISLATQEQSSGFVLVNDAISRLDTMTSQNTQLVVESKHAADDLRDQATTLSQGLSVFRFNPPNRQGGQPHATHTTLPASPRRSLPPAAAATARSATRLLKSPLRADC